MAVGGGELGSGQALLTDLYELTMAQSYFHEGMAHPATFSLFVRALPPDRGYLVACGLEDALCYLEGLRFTTEDIDYLHGLGIFADDFLDFLKSVRFTGDVWAVPEGRLVFANEPLLEVTAPIIEAQMVETFLINQLNLQTVIATKAARCVYAARGRRVVDFALRRTHGTDAGMKVARASAIAGFLGTSNVAAGKAYGLPVVGTMAHSYVVSFEHEIDAFRAYARSFPQRCVLLIDTYDTIAGAHKAAQVGLEMKARGQQLAGVRIDSGDLLALGHAVRRILDEAGLPEVQLVASGGLDEYEIDAMCRLDAPYASFGVGTRMGVSADAPWTDMAYKLVRYGQRPVLKLSTGKATLPDAKQVYRFTRNGRLEHDVIALRDESVPQGEPLLQQYMAGGRRTRPSPSLEEARQGFLDEFARLDEGHKALRDPAPYPVRLSPGLQALASELQEQLAASEGGGVVARWELGESR